MIEHTSNRHFGYIFSAIFIFAAIFFTQNSIDFALSISLFICSLVIFILSVFSPSFLSPFNSAWMALGHLLGRIVSPIVLGVIFFLLITPVALVGRLAGRDPLRLKSLAISSYWIKREPAGPAPDSFKNQF